MLKVNNRLSQSYIIRPNNTFPPECLIYKIPYITNNGTIYLYNMADFKTGEFVGEMYGGVVKETVTSGYYPSPSTYDSFKIERLCITQEREGYGTKFLKFAEKESLALGCGGRVHLLASRLFSPRNPPHLFYRKNGFTSQNTKLISYFDECIREHKQIDIDMADNLEMYLEKYKQIAPIPRWKVYLRFFKRFFK